MLVLPGKAVMTVAKTNTPANISADTSAVMSAETEKSAGGGEHNRISWYE